MKDVYFNLKQIQLFSDVIEKKSKRKGLMRMFKNAGEK